MARAFMQDKIFASSSPVDLQLLTMACLGASRKSLLGKLTTREMAGLVSVLVSVGQQSGAVLVRPGASVEC